MAPNTGRPERIKKFGNYWLLRRLGECSEGELWLACSRRDVSARSICALKRPLPYRFAEPESIKRFVDEIRISDLLSHPNIGRTLDAGSVRGEPFLTTEFMEGKSLDHILKSLRGAGRTFPLPLAIHLGICVCRALAYAHKLTGPGGRQLQLIHRNLNPNSLLISYAGDIKIIEFGMATSRLKESQTMPGMRMPDTTYQCPEFLQGKPVDPRSDIFSLGVILWELCSGESPVQTPADQSVWLKSGRERFASPSRYRKGVPQQIDYAVMRALNNDPRERFQSAAEMEEVLRQILDTLAPGYEKDAQRQMSQFMRSIFDSTWLSERHQLMRALQSVQKIASREMPLSRNSENSEEDGGEDEEEHTVAMISDDEMQEFDESEPFTSTGESPVLKSRQKSRRDREKAAPKSRSEGNSFLTSIQKSLHQLKEILGIIGIAILVSAAAALLILLLRSLGQPAVP